MGPPLGTPRSKSFEVEFSGPRAPWAPTPKHGEALTPKVWPKPGEFAGSQAPTPGSALRHQRSTPLTGQKPPGSAPPPPGSAGSQAPAPGSAPPPRQRSTPLTSGRKPPAALWAKDGNDATPRPLGLFSAICFLIIVVLLLFTVVVSLLFVISRPKHI
jgi:hypothetical protein